MKTLFIGSKSTGSDARKTRWGVLASSLAAVALLAAPLVIDIGTQGASGLIGSAKAAPRLCDDGTRPPCNDAGGEPPVEFGDLVFLYRDENGVPFPTEAPELCQQALAFDSAADPDPVCPDECVIDSYPLGADVVDYDPATCAVLEQCGGCTQEVEFGRINEARSPATVLESQLEDVIVTLATADCRTLDPAGRLVASLVDDTTLDNLAKTVDSPLQNLAIYRQLMLTGALAVELPQDATVLDTAARGLGAASDKSGGVNMDLVHYLNLILGLDAVPTYLGKLCETYNEEVQGVVQPVEKCFLNYGSDLADVPPIVGGLNGANYDYTRSVNFGALPAPPYIPKDVNTPGWFEYLAVVDPLALVPSFQIDQGPIQDAVFCVDGEGNPLDPVFATPCVSLPPLPGTVEEFSGSNIGAFAQAADDARAVIAFMHNWQVPVGYETAVPCTASGEVFYDLSISEQSGLQVPKNYVNGTEREFTVTVGNAGPAPANGSVTLTAEADGVTVLQREFEFTALPAGGNESFGELFTIDTSSDTIAWTATAVAGPPGTDPNPGNNEVTATSSVRATGGGGGGNRP